MVLLLTGGSSGIGQATALYFVHKGFRVYEMSRSGKDHDGVRHIDGDVTDPEVCRKCVASVLEKEGSIDVLICNAGMGISGSAEFCTSQDMHCQMEVNFFGVVNMVQAVLPSMRTHRQGRILVVSSLTSVFSIPFQSFYSASKSAVNAFASALRNEVAPYGIQVGLLLPGDVKTGFTDARCKNVEGSEFYPQQNRAVAAMEKDEKHGQSVERLARRLFLLSQCRYLPLYNYEGWGYRCLIWVYRFLPMTFVNWVVGRLYR